MPHFCGLCGYSFITRAATFPLRAFLGGVTRLTHMRNLVTLLVLSVALSACGEEEKKPPEPTPVEKCEALFNVTCDRMLSCIGEAKAEAEDFTHDKCLDVFRLLVPCGKVTSVSMSYDRCVQQTREWSCKAVLEGVQPADCRDLFALEE